MSFSARIPQLGPRTSEIRGPTNRSQWQTWHREGKDPAGESPHRAKGLLCTFTRTPTTKWTGSPSVESWLRPILSGSYGYKCRPGSSPIETMKPSVTQPSKTGCLSSPRISRVTPRRKCSNLRKSLVKTESWQWGHHRQLAMHQKWRQKLAKSWILPVY